MGLLDRNAGDVGALPDGYRLHRYVGRGSFATVYEGRDPRGEPVAIKLLTNEKEKAVRRFRREIAVLRALPESPNVVAYRHHGVTAGGQAFLVMEYVDGTSLSDVTRAGTTLPEPDACALMCQLCDALAELHKLGVTHGDIKPSNIMLERGGGTVKLLDFGLVRDAQGLLRLLEEVQILDGDEFGENIDRGVLIGTPAYLSPEQISDASLIDWSRRRTDTPSDVYSLGVIFYELLSGRLPYPFELNREACTWENLSDYLSSRTKMEDSQVVELEDSSRELWTIIRKALRQDPKRRQGDARLLKTDIDKYVTLGVGIPDDDDDAETFFVDSDEIKALASAARARAAAARSLAPPPPPPPVRPPPRQPGVRRTSALQPRPPSRPAMRMQRVQHRRAAHEPSRPKREAEMWPIIVFCLSGVVALALIAAALLWNG